MKAFLGRLFFTRHETTPAYMESGTSKCDDWSFAFNAYCAGLHDGLTKYAGRKLTNDEYTDIASIYADKCAPHTHEK